jgi:hypothetical protein
MFWCAADPFLRRTRLDPYEAWKRRFDRAQRGRKGRLGGRGQEERRSLFQAVASPAPHVHARRYTVRSVPYVQCCTVLYSTAAAVLPGESDSCRSGDSAACTATGEACRCRFGVCLTHSRPDDERRRRGGEEKEKRRESLVLLWFAVQKSMLS